MYQCTYYTNYTTMYVYHHVTRLFIYKLHWPCKWKCGVELITHSFTFNLKQWIVLSLRHLESKTLNNIRTLLIDVNYIALTILNHNFVCLTQWRIPDVQYLISVNKTSQWVICSVKLFRNWEDLMRVTETI